MIKNKIVLFFLVTLLSISFHVFAENNNLCANLTDHEIWFGQATLSGTGTEDSQSVNITCPYMVSTETGTPETDGSIVNVPYYEDPSTSRLSEMTFTLQNSSASDHCPASFAMDPNVSNMKYALSCQVSSDGETYSDISFTYTNNNTGTNMDVKGRMVISGNGVGGYSVDNSNPASDPEEQPFSFTGNAGKATIDGTGSMILNTQSNSSFNGVLFEGTNKGKILSCDASNPLSCIDFGALLGHDGDPITALSYDNDNDRIYFAVQSDTPHIYSIPYDKTNNKINNKAGVTQEFTIPNAKGGKAKFVKYISNSDTGSDVNGWLFVDASEKDNNNRKNIYVVPFENEAAETGSAFYLSKSDFNGTVTSLIYDSSDHKVFVGTNESEILACPFPTSITSSQTCSEIQNTADSTPYNGYPYVGIDGMGLYDGQLYALMGRIQEDNTPHYLSPELISCSGLDNSNPTCKVFSEAAPYPVNQSSSTYYQYMPVGLTIIPDNMNDSNQVSSYGGVLLAMNQYLYDSVNLTKSDESLWTYLYRGSSSGLSTSPSYTGQEYLYISGTPSGLNDPNTHLWGYPSVSMADSNFLYFGADDTFDHANSKNPGTPGGLVSCYVPYSDGNNINPISYYDTSNSLCMPGSMSKEILSTEFASGLTAPVLPELIVSDENSSSSDDSLIVSGQNITPQNTADSGSNNRGIPVNGQGKKTFHFNIYPEQNNHFDIQNVHGSEKCVIAYTVNSDGTINTDKAYVDTGHGCWTSYHNGDKGVYIVKGPTVSTDGKEVTVSAATHWVDVNSNAQISLITDVTNDADNDISLSLGENGNPFGYESDDSYTIETDPGSINKVNQNVTIYNDQGNAIGYLTSTLQNTDTDNTTADNAKYSVSSHVYGSYSKNCSIIVNKNNETTDESTATVPVTVSGICETPNQNTIFYNQSSSNASMVVEDESGTKSDVFTKGNSVTETYTQGTDKDADEKYTIYNNSDSSNPIGNIHIFYHADGSIDIDNTDEDTGTNSNYANTCHVYKITPTAYGKASVYINGSDCTDENQKSSDASDVTYQIRLKNSSDHDLYVKAYDMTSSSSSDQKGDPTNAQKTTLIYTTSNFGVNYYQSLFLTAQSSEKSCPVEGYAIYNSNDSEVAYINVENCFNNGKNKVSILAKSNIDNIDDTDSYTHTYEYKD